MPRLRPTRSEVRQQVQAWAAAFVRNTGGHFECEPGLPLPELLRSLGYAVRSVGVDIFEIDVPD